MATEAKDVELRIRARDLSTKTFEDVSKALDKLADAQKSQLDASKKGQTSAKELEASYKAIEQTVQALVNQHNLTKVFQAQAEALEQAKTKADAARQAQTEYANSISAVEEPTKKQIAAQEKLARAVAAADKAQITAQNRLDGTVAKLAAYGIATENIGSAQAQLVAAVNRGNAALETQDQALQENEANMRKAAAVAQQAADEKVAAAKREAQALQDAAAAAAQAAARQATQQRATDAGAAARAAAQKNLVAERALAQAMRESADQAEASAKGYATLARSVTSVRGDELSRQLQAIVDPTATANRNINLLGENIDKLATQVNAINGPVKNFRNTMAELEATQRASAGIASQIDAYRRQIDTLRQARQEYAQARASVISLTSQMRAGGGDAAELSKQLRASESALASSATTMQRTVSSTRAMRDALRAAGVDTQNLAQSETQLIDQARKATTAVDKLSDAFNRHGAAAEKGAKGNFKWFESTRTTLSYTQRLRGEVLALATAYVGVQGAIGAATGAIEAYKNAQKIEGQLGAAFGNDAKIIREEWTYLMNVANRIGISFNEAAPAYAKFAIAAKSFGASGQEIRFMFEQLAAASRVAGLSADEFEGVLKAVEQSFSKGTVQAEELRGQLGDRLPGAFTLMAKSLGVTTAELGKMMEQGQVTADAFISFARELPNQFKLTETALNGLQASQARYNNALFEFQVAVAQSGFADAYTKLLTDLATLMKSADGQAFAQALSSAFSTVVDVLRFTIENVDALKTILSVLVGIAVGRWAFTAVSGFVALLGAVGSLVTMARGAVIVLGAGAGLSGVLAAAGASATAAAGGVGILRGALLLLSRTVPLIAAVSAAIAVAVFAYDKLTAAKKRSEEAGKAEIDAENKRLLARAPQPGVANTADPGNGFTAEQRARAAADKEAEARQKKLDKDRKSALKKSAKDELDERQQLIKDEYQALRDGINANIKDKEEASKRLITIDKQEKQALETDRIRFQAEHAKANQAAADKEVGLRERVKNELLKIEDDLARDAAKADQGSSFEERRATRLEAIAHSYDKLKKAIAELSVIDKAGAADAGKKLDKYILQRQELEGVKVTTEEIKRLEKELTDQTTIRDTKLKEQRDLYDAGRVSQEEFLANTADINERGDSAIRAAASNLQTFVDAAVAAQSGLLSMTEQAEIRAKTTAATAGASNTGNKIADQSILFQEQAIDALIAKRAAAEAIFKTQFDLRMIDEDTYAQKVNENAEMYKSQILQLTQLILQQLEAQRAQGILEGTLNPQRLAALDAQIAKYQQLGVATQNAQSQQDLLGRSLTGGLTTALNSSLDGVANSLVAMAQGTATVGEGFRAMGATALEAMSQMLLQIAKLIIQQMILNALAGGIFGSTVGGAARAAGGVAAVNHRGAIVGQANGRKRAVEPGWFVNAPRLHEGGLPGLRSDEVATILQKGEQVLSRDDPNNVLNGGGAAAAAAASRGSVKVVNTFDAGSFISEGLNTTEGEEAVFNHVRANRTMWKQALDV